MRNGDFSNSPTLSGNLTLDAHSQALLASEGGPIASRPNYAESACLDPIAVGLLKAYVPLPNNLAGGFQNYINQDPQKTSQIDYQFRVDHQINKNNQLIGRIMYEQVLNAFPTMPGVELPITPLPTLTTPQAFNGLLRVQSSITPTC